MAKKALILSLVVTLVLSSCNLPATPQTPPAPSSTSTQVNGGMVAVTDTVPPPQTTEAADSHELCDNDYFPSDDDTTWTFSGSNSKTGDYTRTDQVTDSTDYGFIITTKLTKITYASEFTCTEAGLINLMPAMGQLSAIFSGPDGTVTVTPTMNSGITIPREFKPGDTWNQYFAWNASSPIGNENGSFNYHYTAMGPEVVTVPFGTFDAMRIDASIDVEIGYQKSNSTYTVSFWMVQDIGIVKMEGSMDMRGVEFSDTIELVSYDSP
jgi:hypothetical protein